MSPDAAAPLVSAESICVLRGGRAILDHVTLSIAPGECVTVVGPNGAGKTTLIQAMMGLIPPDHGRVVRRAGLRIGYVPQRFAVEATLPISVRGFLRLSPRRNAATFAALARVLEECGIHGLEHALLHTLSGGEMQRVLVARALLAQPDLLVLDEPVQHLDVGGQLALYELLRRIQKDRQCAVLMVSHDLHMVMANTTRVVCLYHHICCSGAPEHVTTDPAFLALFGPEVARMLAMYHHHHGHEHGHDHGHDHVHGL